MVKIHPEVNARYYGCGLVHPQVLEGMNILDLGSGSGRDCYILAYLAGEHGSVVGVDMTDEQLEVANRHLDYHREQFGYGQSNVRFLKGYIEQLDKLGLQDNSFDIIVSNCVINLSPDKESVLREAYRVLRPGGELYFSDVYCDRRLSEEIMQHKELRGECLGGALYWNDFENLARKAGFTDPRLVEDRVLTVNNPEFQALLEPARFYSATYRLFKLEGLESHCEDYGQAVCYRGTIAEHPHVFELDKHHHIEAGRIFPVCGNTWKMLKQTRFAQHFDFYGDGKTHYGIFKDCGHAMPFDDTSGSGASGGGCC